MALSGALIKDQRSRVVEIRIAVGGGPGSVQGFHFQMCDPCSEFFSFFKDLPGSFGIFWVGYEVNWITFTWWDSSRIFKDFQGFVWDFERSLWIISNFQGFSKILWGFFGVLFSFNGFSRISSDPSFIISNFQEMLRIFHIFQDFSGFSGFYRILLCSSGIFSGLFQDFQDFQRFLAILLSLFRIFKKCQGFFQDFQDFFRIFQDSFVFLRYHQVDDEKMDV